MLPAYNASQWSVVYFGSFVIFGHIILLSVFVALVYDTYSVLRKDQLLEERVYERRALATAFYLMTNGEKEMSYEQWSELISYLKPKWKENQKKFLFKKINVSNNSKLILTEFFEICDALLLRFQERTVEPGPRRLELPPIFKKIFDSK